MRTTRTRWAQATAALTLIAAIIPMSTPTWAQDVPTGVDALVITRGDQVDDSPQTTWVRSTPDGFAEMAVFPFPVVAAGTRLWVWESSTEDVVLCDAYRDEQEDCPTSAEVEVAEIRELGGGDTVPILGLRSPTDLNELCLLHDSASFAVLGRYLLVHQRRWSLYCGAAHPTWIDGFGVRDLQTGDVVDLLSAEERAAIGAREALRAVDDLEHCAESRPLMTMLETSYAPDGTLQVGYQFTADCTYVDSDSAWDDYTCSATVPAESVPARLAEVGHLPDGVRAFLDRRGSDVLLGWSGVDDESVRTRLACLALELAICDGRGSCRVESCDAAGNSWLGWPQYVAQVEVTTPQMAARWDELHEYWSGALDGEGAVHRQLILRSDDEEADFVDVEVGPNRFDLELNSLRRWGGTFELDLQLSPPQILRECRSSWSRMNYTSGNERCTDWEGFAASGSWSELACGPDGEPISHGELDYESVDSPSHALIPRVSVDPDFAVFGWRSTALGSCSLRVSAELGPVIHGEPGDAADAEMRVLLGSNRLLFVEVLDDRLISDAERWLYDDHIELWLGRDRPYVRDDECLPTDQPLYQWGIRLSDGEVFSAYGRPELNPSTDTEAITDASGRQGARLRLVLPDLVDALGETPMITVVYSDSDDGSTQERLIATSPFGYGEWVTLGDAFDVPPRRGRCEPVDGVLEFRPTGLMRDPMVPLLDSREW